ncbi:hypothetical protein ACFL0X_00060 [Nanoarchaeota archaeon]
MRIGIIGPSELKDFYKIKQVAEIVAKLKHEVVLTPDKGSTSEFFAKEYLNAGGKKVFEVVPLDDKEFGYDWVNLELGENINCGTWRNQPEKLNEECDVLVCLGYSAGGLAEIAYTKWFPKGKVKKPVYIIEELVSGKLPSEIKLDLRYVSIGDLEKVLR